MIMYDKIPSSRRLMVLGMLACLLGTSGCQPDDSPLKAENESLKKQVTKQESLVTSLQDNNKIMQQQIDLLNQELRDAKQTTERLNEQLDEQLAYTERIREEVQKAAATDLKIDDKGAQFDTLPSPVVSVTKVVEGALSRNGYRLKVGAKMGPKAVYMTERKVSKPTSLEVAGFRNQYLVSLQAVSGNGTKLGVKAEFEKLAQGGRILKVSADETAEIERRLINEIRKTLTSAGKPSGKP